MPYQVANLTHRLGYGIEVLASTTSEEGVELQHLLLLSLPLQESQLHAHSHCHLVGSRSSLPLTQTSYLCCFCDARVYLGVYLTEGEEPDDRWQCLHLSRVVSGHSNGCVGGSED